MNTAKKIEDLNFEDALGELETIVQKLETGQTSLENAITSYERGVLLKTHCEKKLNEAKAKIEKINVAPDGSITKTPLDPIKE